MNEPNEGFLRSDISGYFGLWGDESRLGDFPSFKGCSFLLLVKAADPFLSVRLFFMFLGRYYSLSLEISDI